MRRDSPRWRFCNDYLSFLVTGRGLWFGVPSQVLAHRTLYTSEDENGKVDIPGKMIVMQM